MFLCFAFCFRRGCHDDDKERKKLSSSFSLALGSVSSSSSVKRRREDENRKSFRKTPRNVHIKYLNFAFIFPLYVNLAEFSESADTVELLKIYAQRSL